MGRLGRQVVLFLTPSDTAEMEARLRAAFPLVAFKYRSPAPQPALVETLAVPEMGKSDLALWLAHPADLPRIEFREGQRAEAFYVDELQSPVVEFSQCFFDGHVLRQGRLYFIPRRQRPDGALEPKEPRFVDWATGLLKVAVKGLQRDKDLNAYVGKEATKLRERGECVIEPFSIGSSESVN